MNRMIKGYLFKVLLVALFCRHDWISLMVLRKERMFSPLNHRPQVLCSFSHTHTHSCILYPSFFSLLSVRLSLYFSFPAVFPPSHTCALIARPRPALLVHACLWSEGRLRLKEALVPSAGWRELSHLGAAFLGQLTD